MSTIVILLSVQSKKLTVLMKRMVPQKPVEEWGREDVQKWLSLLGMQRYEDKFRAIQGRVGPVPLTGQLSSCIPSDS